MNKSESSISLVAFVAILFAVGFAPYITQNAFATHSISAYVANDPDDGDTVFSSGDTLTISSSAPTNATVGAVSVATDVTGNFTFAGNPLGTFTTDWTASWLDTSTLQITIVNVGTGISIGADTVAGDASNNIGDLSGDEGLTTATSTLSGDFGLFVAVTTGGNGGCNGDCFHPTLGVDDRGKRLVDDGFSYNGNSIDVERYFTPYPLVTVNVGKQNVAEFKIYDNRGPDYVRHFELAFGLGSGQIIGESKAVIIWDKTFDRIETVTLEDPENVLDKIKVTTSEGKCSDGLQQKCLIVKVVHTFRAPLDFNILGTKIWDDNRNGWQNYFNHGIEVVGKSLNPPKEYDGISKGQIYHLTETGKTSAVDEFGNSWSLKYGLWEMDYIPTKKIIDGYTKHGIDRNNAWFNVYKQGQELIAKEVLEQYCPSCSDDEFAEINDIFAYELPKQIDKLLDLETLNKMSQESIIAENTLNQIFDSLYRNFHY